jgi:hypothetical protein
MDLEGEFQTTPAASFTRINFCYFPNGMHGIENIHHRP